MRTFFNGACAWADGGTRKRTVKKLERTSRGIRPWVICASMVQCNLASFSRVDARKQRSFRRREDSSLPRKREPRDKKKLDSRFHGNECAREGATLAR